MEVTCDNDDNNDDEGPGGCATGQLISEWLFDVLNFSKKTKQKIDEYLPQNLISGWIKKIEALYNMLNSPYLITGNKN